MTQETSKNQIKYNRGDDVHNASINLTGYVREDLGDKVEVRHVKGIEIWDKSNIELLPKHEGVLVNKYDIKYNRGDDVHNSSVNLTGYVREDLGDKVEVRHVKGIEIWDKSDIEPLPRYEDDFSM